MTYIDTNARTSRVTPNEMQIPIGRQPVLNGLYMGFIKDASDVQRNGRLRVWIPSLGSAPSEEKNWMLVSYCSPFAGATNVNTTLKTDVQEFNGTQTSYGMWMIPPDIDNIVLVMFINGDPAAGVWIGCLYNQFINEMVPGMAADVNSYQYPGKIVPLAEYNKKDKSVTQPDRAIKPYERTKFQGLGNQGLITDTARGTTTSSARRESPSQVFGILTPGPVVDSNAAPENIRRKGGSSFIMDDGAGTEYVQLTTKSGAQIRLDETNGFVYLINRDGTSWVQMDQEGNIDIFGAQSISMRAQYDINLRADRNINLEAGQNIFMKAAQDTQTSTTSFTYDVNNIPTKVDNLTYYEYVGEGNGEGGNIVMQSLNSWHSTAKNSAFLTVVQNDMNIDIGNAFVLTTIAGGQDYNSKMGIKMTTGGAFDFAATGNIRVGTNGTLSVVSAEDTTFCSGAGTNIKSTGDMTLVAGGNILSMTTDFSIIANILIEGPISVTGDLLVSGGIGGGGSATIGGTLNSTGDLNIAGTTNVGQLNFSTANDGVPPPVVTPPGPPTPSIEPNPPAADTAMTAAQAIAAEVKAMNDKTNILATWNDPVDKFKRNSEAVTTTVSRLATYEPCPEHESFTLAKVAGFTPNLNQADQTYAGSSGIGNNQATVPPASTVPGTNNTSVPNDTNNASDYSKDININALRCQLITHEGLVNKSYLDTTNLLHGGIGHLLRSDEVATYPLGSPISDAQVETWYQQDSGSAIKIAMDLLGDTWGNLSDIRKRAVVDLSYNLGKARLAQFTQFLTALKAENYNVAGQELMNSKWYVQVKRRGKDVTTMIVSDVDPTNCAIKFPN